VSEAATLSSIPAAHAWLVAQGYELTERSVRNHVEQGLLPAEKSRNGKVKQIRLLDLERYAKSHLQRKENDEGADRARLIKAQAEKIELENDAKRGKYLDRAEEEQRDAAVLAAFRRHLENAAPDRLQAIIAQVGKLVDAETRNKIAARQPEWLQKDMDFMAKMFDRFGGG